MLTETRDSDGQATAVGFGSPKGLSADKRIISGKEVLRDRAYGGFIKKGWKYLPY